MPDEKCQGKISGGNGVNTKLSFYSFNSFEKILAMKLLIDGLKSKQVVLGNHLKMKNFAFI